MSKQHISRLAALMTAKGIHQVVVSPGSRNAPVIILFGQSKDIQLISVADERSAAFFATGLAMRSQQTVALLCTSGSAVLNFAPAISEAYYQKLPLLIITADRPVELIDQGDSQTIRQQNIYANYIRKSFHAPVEIRNQDDEWYFDRIVNEAIDRTKYPVAGPVHLNLPLNEPLYDLSDIPQQSKHKIIQFNQGIKRFAGNTIKEIARLWQSASSKLIVAGQMMPGSTNYQQLIELAADPTVTVLTECTSNLPHKAFINCIDRTLAQIPLEKNDAYKPQILLTLGGAIVSKKVKAMLREMHPRQHWHIDPDPEGFHMDTYKSLTATFDVDADVFLQQLLLAVRPVVMSNPVGYQVPGNETDEKAKIPRQKSIGYNNAEPLPTPSYAELWKKADNLSLERHNKFLSQTNFCDLKAYELIFEHLPHKSAVHLANSTPVRYAQLFDQRQDVTFYSNRGTSGIDGCTSTAAGFAFNHKSLTVLITGDIAFFYDSNALWNQNLSPELRIIMVNNGGGNIFRIIEGPAGHSELEPFIETRHTYDAKALATNFNVNYYSSGDYTSLVEVLPQFFSQQKNHRPALLEIFTDNVASAQTLKNYFGFLRNEEKGTSEKIN